MEFKDGDFIRGQYGNKWQRRDGRWYNVETSDPITSASDKTMEYLLGLKVDYPKPSTPKERKLSKSAPVEVPVYVYNFVLEPGD
jgi:hypothetical protein